MATTKNNSPYGDGFRRGLAPDPPLTVSQWADQHRILAAKSSAEPGPFRTSRTPYMRDIMDELSPFSPTQKVVFMKGGQIGGSEAGLNWLGYVVDQAPGPMLYVLPTIGLAERGSKQRITPLFEACPRLRDKVGKGSKTGGTILEKDFPGGTLIITGANSAQGLCSMPARYVFLDEVDRYPVDVDGEGDPCALAEKRASTFARRKIYYCSTPTHDGRSKIQSEYEASDKRRFHMPCPHCGHFQWLKWDRIRWPKDAPEKAYYLCESCEAPIEEHHKTAMLEAGRWIAENPSAGGGKVAGFHLSALYSPLGWYSWGMAAREFVDAKGNPEKLRAFVNMVLGEVWKSKGDAPDWKRIYERRETYAIGRIPREAVFLTAGADVQKDRIEVEIQAWGPGKESWSIDYRVLPGDTSTLGTEAWNALDALLAETFPHESGMELSIRMLAIDSSFNTQTVYNWARRYPITRVIAVKGVESQPIMIGQPSAVDITYQGQRIARGFKVWPIGVNMIKSELYGLLKLEKPLDGELYPPGFCHFPEYADEYFKQLTAEQIVLRVVRGFKRAIWEKTRERNEALDCRVYNRVAAAALGIDRMRDEHWVRMASAVGATVGKQGQPVATGSNHSQPAQPEAQKYRRKTSFV